MNQLVDFVDIDTFFMKLVGPGVEFDLSGVLQLKAKDALMGDAVLVIRFKIAFLHPVDHGFTGHLEEMGRLGIAEIALWRSLYIHNSLFKNVANIRHL